jgi:hypothetical protein
MCDCVDDEFVENKFRKNHSNQTPSEGFNDNKIHVKNFD